MIIWAGFLPASIESTISDEHRTDLASWEELILVSFIKSLQSHGYIPLRKVLAVALNCHIGLVQFSRHLAPLPQNFPVSINLDRKAIVKHVEYF